VAPNGSASARHRALSRSVGCPGFTEVDLAPCSGDCAEGEFTHSCILATPQKDDDAHIEEKNCTRGRRLIGWDRCDSVAAVGRLNDLYRDELRLMT